MEVAKWMIEDGTFKCVPGGWSSEDITFVSNALQARLVSLKLVFRFVQFLVTCQMVEKGQ